MSYDKKAFALPKQYKRIAVTIADQHDRGLYIRMMLDALKSEHEWKNTRRHNKEKTNDA